MTEPRGIRWTWESAWSWEIDQARQRIEPPSEEEKRRAFQPEPDDEP